METKFNIGDKVWVALAEQQEKKVECPECCGKRKLQVILGDGTVVSIDCECCKYGYEGSRGFIQTNEFYVRVEPDTITGAEIEFSKIRYKLQTHYTESANIFATKEEAEARSAVQVIEQAAREAIRMKQKERQEKSWAWNAAYHRREIRDFKKRIAYHEAKLAAVPTDKDRDSSDENQ